MSDLKIIKIDGVLESNRSFAYDDSVIEVSVTLPSGKSLICAMRSVDEWAKNEVDQVRAVVNEVTEFVRELTEVGAKAHVVTVSAKGWY